MRQCRSSRPGRAACLAACLLGAAIPSAAEERTVIERAIAEQNPCRDLRTEVFGAGIGIDRLEDVTLDEVDFSLRGDDTTIDLAGGLTCRTADEALLRGNAGASIRASAQVLLTDCSVPAIDVVLGEFHGDFGDLLAAAAPLLETALEDAGRETLARACQDFQAD